MQRQNRNRNLFMSGLILLGVAWLIISNNVLTGMWHRNAGMIMLARRNLGSSGSGDSSAILAELQAAQQGANDLLLQSRLASLRKTTIAAPRNTTPVDCENDYSRFAAVIAEPQFAVVDSPRLIQLSVFERVGEAQGAVKFKASAQNTCEAQLSTNFVEGLNRYVTLSARTPVQPDATYRLTAQVLVEGNLQAYFGVQSRWQENKLSANPGWQNVNYTFHTGSDATSENVQVLVTGGKGSIDIKRLALERLP